MVDVIILTYKPDRSIFDILDRLENQSVKPDRIIIMNTEQKYLEKLIYASRFTNRYPNVEVRHISKLEFNHGRTRNKAAKRSDAEYMVFMTQDAEPADEFLIEELVKPLENNEDAAVSYARQLPRDDASPAEKYTRVYNYPDEDKEKSFDDIEKMGIKAFFCSNVCACYKKSVFEELGGFIDKTIFNEDMIYAYGALAAGYTIYYASKAKVYHSHNYTTKQQFKRNFDLGVSQADHPEIFGGIRSEDEGKRYVRECIYYLIRIGKFYLVPDFVIKCAARYSGYRKGLNYKKLSRKKVLKYTSDTAYWKRSWDLSLGIDVTKGYGKNEEGL